MAYSSGIRKDRVTILNREEARQDAFGLDAGGIGFVPVGCFWADVSWARGKQAMNAGALDVYGVVMVRMLYTSVVTERSRVVHHGKTYQVLPETFHADRQGNTVQFHAQLLLNDK